MPKTKRTKPSKKPTTKVKDLPESVQWLLDFANLGCKAGELSIKNVYGEAKVKRPPSEPATLKKILFEYDCTAKILSNVDRLSIQKMNEIVAYVDKGIYSRKFLDVNDNEWLVTTTGETIYCGKISDYPLLKEIKSFLLKAGISIDSIKNENISEVWFVAKASLCSMLDAHYLVKTYAQGFVYNYYNLNQIQPPKICVDDINSLINGLRYTHDNTLFQVACASVLDFWHNHRELHKRLRQCPCCGKFEVEKVTKGVRGRKKEYCSDKCKKRFGHDPRWKVRESLRKQREIHSKDEEEIAHGEIVDLLCKKGGYTSEEAKEIFNKHRNSMNFKSLASFKRTYGKKYGLT